MSSLRSALAILWGPDVPTVRGAGQSLALPAPVSVRELISVSTTELQVRLALQAVHCYRTTDGLGSDEVSFVLSYLTANHASGRLSTGVAEGVDAGFDHQFDSGDDVFPSELNVSDPGLWLDVILSGAEHDDWPGGKAEGLVAFARFVVHEAGLDQATNQLGDVRVRLTRRELTMTTEPIRILPMPHLTGSGGDYAVSARLAIAHGDPA